MRFYIPFYKQLPISSSGNLLRHNLILNTLFCRKMSKLRHHISQRLNNFLSRLFETLKHENTRILALSALLANILAETRKICGKAAHAERCCFQRSIPPRLIITRENTQMTALHALVIARVQKTVC